MYRINERPEGSFVGIRTNISSQEIVRTRTGIVSVHLMPAGRVHVACASWPRPNGSIVKVKRKKRRNAHRTRP